LHITGDDLKIMLDVGSAIIEDVKNAH